MPTLAPELAAAAAALDAAIHAWDVAVATGQPSPLTTSLAGQLRPAAEATADSLRGFAYAPPLPEVAGDDEAVSAAALSGARPGVVVTDPDIRPYEVAVAQSDLDDLKDRLVRTKWPDELDGADWDYGVPLDYVKDLVSYWIDEFDWRAHEAQVNAHPQYVTSIDDETVHFIHVPSPEPDALPLIVTHGWPMSVFEYVDLIGPLTDPQAHGGRSEDAFHLVIPSIPGIAFSGPTRTPGWDTDRTARAWVTLMERLGYDRYGAHGNDAGSLISPEVGRHDPDHVVGVHVTQLFSFPSGDPSEFVDLSEEDAAAVQFLEGYTQGGGLAFNAYQSGATADTDVRDAGLTGRMAGLGGPALPRVRRPRLHRHQRRGVLAHRNHRVVRAPLLRGRTRGARGAAAHDGSHRRGDLPGRLPVRAPIRRA